MQDVVVCSQHDPLAGTVAAGGVLAFSSDDAHTSYDGNEVNVVYLDEGAAWHGAGVQDDGLFAVCGGGAAADDEGHLGVEA